MILQMKIQVFQKLIFLPVAKSGALMKSITIAIRNRERRVIGLLCINMNLDVPFSEIIKNLYS